MNANLPSKQGSYIRQGIFSALPIIMGYLPIGFAFGVLAATAGLGVGGAVAMSVFVYAGSAQFIAIGLIEGGAGPLTLAATVFLVNLRHLLMSAYLAPYLGHLKRWQQAMFAYELTDESFGVHSANFQLQGRLPAAQILALNVSAQIAWIMSSLAGAWVGSNLAVDTEVFGLDYALPAMFIALLVLQIDSRRRAALAAAAAALSVTFYLAGAGHWSVILATLAVATARAFTEKDKEELLEEEK